MASYKPAHNISERHRTADVLIAENVDFAGLLLSEAVQKGLTTAGFEKPSPIQLKAIPLGRCGLDLIVQAKSGTGKTCVFSVIALESLQLNSNSTQVLVLAPTREIAVQIHDVILSIGSALLKLRCHVFIGGLPLAQDKQKLNKCHIAVGTPGRIKQLIEEDLINTNTIRLYVLDEADKLLDESFKEQINWIYSALPENKQMLALSATYPEYLAQQLTSYMRDPVFVRLNPKDLALQGLVQYYKVVSYNSLPHKQFEIKVQHLLQLLSQVTFNQCLIFSNYQTRAQNLSDYLCVKGWPSTYISGSQDQTHRLQAMAMLKKFQCRVLISTDLTARGIDAERVNLVVNLDVPYDAKTYLHRIGRAGRFGTQGIAVTYAASGQEYHQLLTIQQDCHIAMKKLPDTITSDLMNQDNKDEMSNPPEETNGKLHNGFYDGGDPSTSLPQSNSDTKEIRQFMNGADTNNRKKKSVESQDNIPNAMVWPSKDLRSVRRKQRKDVGMEVHDGGGEPIKTRARLVTAEKSCQTDSPSNHEPLNIGVIPPLSDDVRNQGTKLTINYQDAVDDFEDFLKTKNTSIDTWKKFYAKDVKDVDNIASADKLSTVVVEDVSTVVVEDVRSDVQVHHDAEDSMIAIERNDVSPLLKEDENDTEKSNVAGVELYASEVDVHEEGNDSKDELECILNENVTKLSDLNIDNRDSQYDTTSSTSFQAQAGILETQIAENCFQTGVNQTTYSETMQNSIMRLNYEQDYNSESVFTDEKTNGLSYIDNTSDGDSSVKEAKERKDVVEQGDWNANGDEEESVEEDDEEEEEEEDSSETDDGDYDIDTSKLYADGDVYNEFSQYYNPWQDASQGAYGTSHINNSMHTGEYERQETTYQNDVPNTYTTDRYDYDNGNPTQTSQYAQPPYPGPPYQGPPGMDHHSQWERPYQGNYPDRGDPSWDWYNAYMYNAWLHEYHMQSYFNYPTPPPPYWQHW
ncbi:uncharacterized protein LOC144453987 [Glandiceps talaboti]